MLPEQSELKRQAWKSRNAWAERAMEEACRADATDRICDSVEARNESFRRRFIGLIERAEQAERERDVAQAALRIIRDAYGQVCEEFETCEHLACQASYSAWQVADAALKGGEG